jgi:hypothetical protein
MFLTSGLKKGILKGIGIGREMVLEMPSLVAMNNCQLQGNLCPANVVTKQWISHNERKKFVNFIASEVTK